MKKTVTLFCLSSCLVVSAAYCQKNTYADMRKEDSIKVASIPDSIKQAPGKKFPGTYEIKWSVLNSHYMAEFNILKADAKSYLSEDGDVIMMFYKGGEEDGKWYMTSVKYNTEEEMVKNIPAEVLERIKSKLMELNKEELSSISAVYCAEKCIHRGPKPGESYIDEPYVSKGYRVWGKITGTQTGGMLSFTAEGEFIPSVY